MDSQAGRHLDNGERRSGLALLQERVRLLASKAVQRQAYRVDERLLFVDLCLAAAAPEVVQPRLLVVHSNLRVVDAGRQCVAVSGMKSLTKSGSFNSVASALAMRTASSRLCLAVTFTSSVPSTRLVVTRFLSASS